MTTLSTNDRATAKPLPCFKPELRQAIRDGRKTQTRRPITPQPDGEFDGPRLFHPSITNLRGYVRPGPATFAIWDTLGQWSLKAPYAPGDVCYLREPLRRGPKGFVCYSEADNGIAAHRIEWTWKTNNLTSIQFPKPAARTFVRITDVRVEQLKDISIDDAIAEGVDETGNRRKSFESLWQSCYGDWQQELWVWVIEWELWRRYE